MKPAPPGWEQVAAAIIESLILGELDAERARAWLKTLLDYAESIGS